MKIDNYLQIANGLVMSHMATGIPKTITLNQKEMQLATDKNPTTLNESWDLMCRSVFEREGVWIEGDFEVDEIVVNGKVRPFH